MTFKFEDKPIDLSSYKGPVSCTIEENILFIVGPLAAVDLEIPTMINLLISTKGVTTDIKKRQQETKEDDQIYISSKSLKQSKLTSDQVSVIGGRRTDLSITRFRHSVLDALQGVTQGFIKDLELIGVGYRSFLKSGNTIKEFKQSDVLCLRVGYSNTLEIVLPPSVRVSCVKPTVISIFGFYKEDVHHFAAKIRHLIRYNPYKGKGIIYEGEIIPRKEGKKH